MEHYSYLIVWFIFWGMTSFYFFKEYKKLQLITNSSDRRNMLWTILFVLAGILVRTIFLSCPKGVEIDESSVGYQAWALATYGIDSEMSSYPIYFSVWETGQSVLYSYLSVPLIKLFGLSEPVLRTPMALIGSFVLILAYYTLNKIKLSSVTVLGIIGLLVINPWHITKCRWAVDANICPDLILIATFLFILGYYTTKEKKRILFFVGAFIMLAISAYGYAVSWFMLPIYVIALFIFLFRKNKIQYKSIILSLVVMGIILVPLILFVWIWAVGGDQFTLGQVTITKLLSTRIESSTGSIADIAIEKIKDGFLLIIADTGAPYKYWGHFYNLLGLPIIIYALFYLTKKRMLLPIDRIFLMWLLSVVSILIFVSPNTTHWNLLWFPLIYFCGRGVGLIMDKSKQLWVFCLVTMITLCSLFCIKYVSVAYRYGNGHLVGGEKPIKYVNTLPVKKIYYPKDMIYTQILFYAPISPYELHTNEKAIKPFLPQFELTYIVRFSRHEIGLPKEILPTASTAYVVPNFQLPEINMEGFNIERGNIYTVLWNE